MRISEGLELGLLDRGGILSERRSGSEHQNRCSRAQTHWEPPPSKSVTNQRAPSRTPHQSQQAMARSVPYERSDRPLADHVTPRHVGCMHSLVRHYPAALSSGSALGQQGVLFCSAPTVGGQHELESELRRSSDAAASPARTMRSEGTASYVVTPTVTVRHWTLSPTAEQQDSQVLRPVSPPSHSSRVRSPMSTRFDATTSPLNSSGVRDVSEASNSMPSGRRDSRNSPTAWRNSSWVIPQRSHVSPSSVTRRCQFIRRTMPGSSSTSGERSPEQPTTETTTATSTQSSLTIPPVHHRADRVCAAPVSGGHGPAEGRLRRMDAGEAKRPCPRPRSKSLGRRLRTLVSRRSAAHDGS